MKRKYVYDEERLSENLYHNVGKSIKDRKSFDKAYDLYITEKTPFTEKAREKVWENISKRHPRLKQEKIVQIREYKGKELKGYAIRYGKNKDIVKIRYRDQKGRFIKTPKEE